MLSANPLPKPHLAAASAGGRYAPDSTATAAAAAAAATAAAAASAAPMAGSAFALGAPAPAGLAPQLHTLAGGSASAPWAAPARPPAGLLPLAHTIAGRDNGACSGGSPLVAPRPVPAQHAGPPPWVLAALPLDVLLGLATPSHPRNIINDVFFTPEQRHESPRLAPLSDAGAADMRVRPAAPAPVPSAGLEAMDPSADLALFADLQVDGRCAWSEIEPPFAARQPSPAATVTGDCDGDAHDAPPAKGSPLSMHVAQYSAQCAAAGADSDTASLSGESCVDPSAAEPATARESMRPTIFEELSRGGVDWCRYCGTTEGINWRPGPWGKRTLCNKHGCDYKGYGFASKMPRLNLKSFADETVQERIRPVLQTFCQVCQQPFSEAGNVLVHCDGCHRAYHQCCHPDGIAATPVDVAWFCEASCRDNARRRRIVVELPKCRLPYMCSPRHGHPQQQQQSQPGLAGALDAPARRSSTISSPAVVRPRKRKMAMCASPEPMDGCQHQDSSRAPSPLGLGPRAHSSKVRKSSRVVRPSARRLESDHGT